MRCIIWETVFPTADVFFGVEWAYRLRNTIPGVYDVIELDGAMLFFTEERASEVSALLREHFLRADADSGSE